jgi:hypothetical protein
VSDVFCVAGQPDCWLPEHRGPGGVPGQPGTVHTGAAGPGPQYGHRTGRINQILSSSYVDVPNRYYQVVQMALFLIARLPGSGSIPGRDMSFLGSLV